MTRAKRRILVTGGTGQVGLALLGRPWPSDVAVIAPGRADLDLASAESLRRLLAGDRFDAIVNCGAYTAVDRAESEVGAAWAVNALAPAILAAHAAATRAPMVQISTDYVFSGDKSSAYVETDPVGPIGVYGASKEGGEQAVRTANGDHAILRTSWVVSATGANFVRTMLRIGAQRPVVRVVDDQWGAPTTAGALAEAIRTVTLRMMDDPNAPRGTYHLTHEGEITWARLAERIFATARGLGGPSPIVERIATADYPTPARRPANSRLDCGLIAREHGVRLGPFEEAVDGIVAALLASDRGGAAP